MNLKDSRKKENGTLNTSAIAPSVWKTWPFTISIDCTNIIAPRQTATHGTTIAIAAWDILPILV